MQNTITSEKLALEVCFKLHGELLKDEFFAGYEGSKEQFDDLYTQIFRIIETELPAHSDADLIIETFYQYETEIAQGLRECDWHLY